MNGGVGGRWAGEGGAEVRAVRSVAEELFEVALEIGFSFARFLLGLTVEASL